MLFKCSNIFFDTFNISTYWPLVKLVIVFLFLKDVQPCAAYGVWHTKPDIATAHITGIFMSTSYATLVSFRCNVCGKGMGCRVKKLNTKHTKHQILRLEWLEHFNWLAQERSGYHSKNWIFNLVLLVGIFRSSIDNALGAVRQQVITWANVDSVPCRLIALLGHN